MNFYHSISKQKFNKIPFIQSQRHLWRNKTILTKFLVLSCEGMKCLARRAHLTLWEAVDKEKRNKSRKIGCLKIGTSFIRAACRKEAFHSQVWDTMI